MSICSRTKINITVTSETLAAVTIWNTLIKTNFSAMILQIHLTLALPVLHGDALHVLGPDAGHDVGLHAPVLEAALHDSVVVPDVDVAVAVLARHLLTAHRGSGGVPRGALWVVAA